MARKMKRRCMNSPGLKKNGRLKKGYRWPGGGRCPVKAKGRRRTRSRRRGTRSRRRR